MSVFFVKNHRQEALVEWTPLLGNDETDELAADQVVLWRTKRPSGPLSE